MHIDLIDAQAGGDVGRVVTHGFPPIPGATVAEKAHFLREFGDGFRVAMIDEPYGNAEQCIDILVEPSSRAADAGLIIMGTMGYPNFSGSNAMCAMVALVDSGQISLTDEGRTVVLETPGGLTRCRLDGHAGSVTSVEYDALPGFSLSNTIDVHLPRYGTVEYQLIDGGAPYIVVDADGLGLDPHRTPRAELTEFFGMLRERVASEADLIHPVHGQLPPPTLGLLIGEMHTDDARNPTIDVAVFMDGGVICQGPTGTGTTAMLTWLWQRDAVPLGSAVRALSPTGNSFTGTVTDTTKHQQHTGVCTRIRGVPAKISTSDVTMSAPF